MTLDITGDDLPRRSVLSLRYRRRVAIWIFALCTLLIGLLALAHLDRLALGPNGTGWTVTLPWSSAPLRPAAIGTAERVWFALLCCAALAPLLVLMLVRQIRPRLLLRLAIVFLGFLFLHLRGWSWFAPHWPTDHPQDASLVQFVLFLALYATLLWTALSEWTPIPIALPGARRLRTAVSATALLTALSVVSGSVATAALPLDRNLHPVSTSLPQTAISLMIDHRLLSALASLAILAVVIWGQALRRPMLPRGPRDALLSLAAVMVVQYVLGIATLRLMMPSDLASLHLIAAVLLLTSALVALHSLRGAVPNEVLV